MPISIDGSGTVTGVSVGGLPDGIVDTDMLAANAVTAAKTSVPGIVEVDQWILTAAKSSNGDITSDLARNTLSGSAAPFGTGMSESSGIFSFPDTGKWLVFMQGKFGINNSDNVDLVMNVTLNNSSYGGVAFISDGQNGSGAREGGGASFYFLDVTDVSQVKVKFSVSSLGSGSELKGSNTVSTAFTFIRIGDT